MDFQILRRQPIEFFENKGVKYFKPFVALDKTKKTLKVYNLEDCQYSPPSIIAENHQGKFSSYEVYLDSNTRTMIGDSLAADPRNQGIGEVLNLAALMEFHKNKFNRFNLFSLKEAIQFYTRFGFKIINEDKGFILNNLKNVEKSKGAIFNELRKDVAFFKPRIEGKISSDDKYLTQRANDVFSNFLKELSRKHIKYNSSKIDHGTNMEFSDWEFEINRDYLNSLFDKHEINYKV